MVNTEHCTEDVPDRVRPAEIRIPMDGRRRNRETDGVFHRLLRVSFQMGGKQVDDEKIFPKKQASVPSDFKKRVKKIAARLFRVYAHLYPRTLRLFALCKRALNTIFKHFVYFAVGLFD